MRVILVLLLSVVCLKGMSQDSIFFANSNAFFKQYVEHGLVAYEDIKNTPGDLNSLVAQIAKFDLEQADAEVKKAFFINAYNILVIKQVVDLYPISGPLKVNGFFNETTFDVAGRSVTLDQLEKNMLFEEFPDPRLHFVLVCAAVGCPPISADAYVPDSLDIQIDRKTRDVMNINWYIRIYKDKTLVSEVFNWYSEDFNTDELDTKSFINSYRELPIPESHVIDTYPYDWSLNDSKGTFRY